MGKRAKSIRSQRRKLEKKQRKEAKKALYKSYAETGKNNRAKNGSIKTPKSGRKGQHIMSDCGNPGCGKCYPHLKVILQVK